MFDNPNEELRKLEQKLLAAEPPKKDPEAEFEAFYGEILREFGPESTNRQRKTSPAKKSAPKKSPKKKEKGIGKLVAMLCLEFAGIAALVIWWILRLW